MMRERHVTRYWLPRLGNRGRGGGDQPLPIWRVVRYDRVRLECERTRLGRARALEAGLL
jgi:hypothetical protein